MDTYLKVGYQGRVYYDDDDDAGWGLWKTIESCDQELWLERVSKEDRYQVREIFIKEE